MSLKEILADGVVDEVEIKALFDKYDTDRSGALEHDELLRLARDVSALLPGGDAEDVLRVIDFYQVDYDDKITPAELKGFLEIHVAE
ncbi:MAG: Ca2+-binding EF-hand superfamily protein [Kiritimatiellia bacterium]|jgi:Ca2+-binding EF-hand superfamily protein